MSDIFWSTNSAANWNSDSWGTTSGGSPVASLRPTSSDSVIFDGNGVGNCTLSASVGSYTDGGSGVFTPSYGCYSVAASSGYTGTFDLNDFNLVTDAGGFDFSAATSATVLSGSGDLFSNGITKVGGTWNRETSRVLMVGGTAGTPAAITLTSLKGFVAGSGSYIAFGASSTVYFNNRGFKNYGNVTGYRFRLEASSGANAHYLHSGSSLSCTSYLHLTGGGFGTNELTGDPTTITTPTLTSYLTTLAGGYYSGVNKLVSGGYAAGTQNFSGCIFNDFKIESSNASYAISGDFSAYGDFTKTFFGAGACTATCDITLIGTADQSIALSGVDLSGASVQGTKTAGNVSLSSTDLVVASGDVLQVGKLTLDATSTVTGTGTVRLYDYSFASGSVFTPAIWDVMDFDGIAIPTTYTGKLHVYATTDASGSVTPSFSGAYDFEEFHLICLGSEDLVIDCASITTINVSGDVYREEDSAGVISWLKSSETLIMDGTGSQNLGLQFGDEANRTLNELQITNTSGSVTVTEYAYADTYIASSGAVVYYEERINPTEPDINGGIVVVGLVLAEVSTAVVGIVTDEFATAAGHVITDPADYSASSYLVEVGQVMP